MKIGKRILIFGLLAILAFQSVLVLGNALRSAAFRTPFGWQDEGYVLGPALAVYDGGWKSYRCRGDQIICYGAVHTFFDVLVLRALPERWVKATPLLEPAGPNWFYQSKYPNAFLALRVFRVVLAASLLVGVGWLSGRALRSIPLGFFWAFALPGFDAFRASRMGLKNDFSFALYLLLFLVFADRSLRERNGRTRLRSFLVGVGLGVLGISVKFGMILPLVAWMAAYLLQDFLRYRRLSKTIVVGTGAIGIGAGAWILSNPGLGVSLSEANWFSSFLAATGRAPTSEGLRSEFFQAIVPNLWPMVFFVFPLIHVFRKDRREWIRWAYLLGVPVVWTVLTWKSAYLRLPYYLPILAWTWVALAWIPSLPRWAYGMLIGGLVIQAIASLPSEMNGKETFEKNLAESSAAEPWKIFSCGSSTCAQRRWMIDRTLRAAVPASLGGDRVLFFDSFTDPPASVRKRVEERWTGTGDRDVRILATCWSDPPETESDPIEYASPAAETWAKVLKGHCSQTVPIRAEAAFAFENGWRPKEFAELEPMDLDGKDGPLPVSRNGLSPRMLEGAWRGVDSWYAPVILKSDATLEGTFSFPKGASDFSLSFESTCKNEGQVEFSVGTEIARASADSKAALCRKRAWVCRLGLENWWTERLPVGSLLAKTRVPVGGVRTLRIRVTGGNPDRCRIALGIIRFNPIGIGEKLGP